MTADPNPDRADAVRVLSRALDQAGDVLARVRTDRLDDTTPCTDWTVGRLADHLCVSPSNFLTMMRGEQPDWSAPDPEVRESWSETFRERADDLIHQWHRLGDAEVPIHPDMQTAEFVVHTWDLAQALGVDTATLDTEAAERGLRFLRANLSDDNRGAAFGPVQQVGTDAGAYEQLAAFAGRRVAGSPPER